MNPIYKTGWGQYVDLSKIVSIQNTGLGCCLIWIQLMEGPIQVSRPTNIAYVGWSMAASGVEYSEEACKSEAFKIDEYLETRELQIDLLISAWENFHNTTAV